MRVSSGRTLTIDFNANPDTPLYRRVYDHIRECILDGRLPPRSPVPSTRTLASELRVSRSTVTLAYTQLRAEGYLTGRAGAATRVKTKPPDPLMRSAAATHQATDTMPTAVPSKRGIALAGIKRQPIGFFGEGPRAFRCGVPAVDIFPVHTWGRLSAHRWRRTPAKALAYGDPLGFQPLREAVAEYLGAARGVRCTADQVMIVPGSQLGLALSCRVLLDPGDEAWLEDPGYAGARGALVAAGARIVPVRVDADGLDVDEGRSIAPRARLAFVTPSRQLPLGVTMSMSRREALVQWARDAGSWIIEDDYDSEFRYSTRPVPALQGMAGAANVIYMGTFSKVTFPAVRLGYLVVPANLIDVFAAARTFSDYSVPYLNQAVMTDFMVQGHFERHIRRMRAIYFERQRILVEAAHRELSPWLRVATSDAGMSVIGSLEDGVDDTAIVAAAAERGVDLAAISANAINPIRPGLLLGYAGVREIEIREGVARLGMMFRSLERDGKPASPSPGMPLGNSYRITGGSSASIAVHPIPMCRQSRW